MKNSMTAVAMVCLMSTTLSISVHAQDYVSPTQPTETGKAPGMKAKLVNSNGEEKTYVIAFKNGDEVKSGLTDFAKKYNVKAAHLSGLGDASLLKVGFYDYGKKMFKVIQVDTAEISSFTGNITLFNGQPTVHVHTSGAISDGSVHGGHLLELVVGPTFEVFVTVEPTAVNKKKDETFNAAVIDIAP